MAFLSADSSGDVNEKVCDALSKAEHVKSTKAHKTHKPRKKYLEINDDWNFSPPTQNDLLNQENFKKYIDWIQPESLFWFLNYLEVVLSKDGINKMNKIYRKRREDTLRSRLSQMKTLPPTLLWWNKFKEKIWGTIYPTFSEALKERKKDMQLYHIFLNDEIIATSSEFHSFFLSLTPEERMKFLNFLDIVLPYWEKTSISEKHDGKNTCTFARFCYYLKKNDIKEKSWEKFINKFSDDLYPHYVNFAGCFDFSDIENIK